MFDSNPAARVLPLAEQIALLGHREESVVTVGAVGSSTLTVKLAR